jgi:hypothetical protein
MQDYFSLAKGIHIDPVFYGGDAFLLRPLNMAV